MKQTLLRITLLEPLSLSSESTTVGAHHTLDYIPGRVLLGLAASRCYADLGDDAFDVFHSGRVRFTDAMPSFEGHACHPMPYAFHLPKRRASEYYINRAITDGEAGVQYVQQRSGYLSITKDGAMLVRPSRGSAMKTSIEAGAGSRASQGGLFSMEYLSKGVTFIASICADEDIDDQLISRLIHALTGRARIGRSRSAQFGAIEIEEIMEPRHDAGQASLQMHERLTVLLLSDLALHHPETGSPRLTAEARDFGLPEGWKLVEDRCFVRHRSYDRFNGYRKAFDLRRAVLCRGSVLTFEGSSPLTAPQAEAVMERRARGAGLDRQEGLGQFELAPDWLMTPTIRIIETSRDTTPLPSVAPPDPALLAFLQRRQPNLGQRDRERIEGHVQAIGRKYKSARGKLPSQSQWSRVRRWAMTTATFDRSALARLVGGTSGKLSRGWETRLFGEGFDGIEIADWLLSLTPVESDKSVFISELAHQIRASLNRAKHGGTQ